MPNTVTDTFHADVKDEIKALFAAFANCESVDELTPEGQYLTLEDIRQFGARGLELTEWLDTPPLSPRGQAAALVALAVAGGK